MFMKGLIWLQFRIELLAIIFYHYLQRLIS